MVKNQPTLVNTIVKYCAFSTTLFLFTGCMNISFGSVSPHYFSMDKSQGTVSPHSSIGISQGTEVLEWGLDSSGSS
jgi:hypothetical protein